MHDEYDDCRGLDSDTARVMALHAVSPKSRGVLQLLEIYTALVVVILISYVVALECFIAVYESPYVFSHIPDMFRQNLDMTPDMSAEHASYLVEVLGISCQVGYVIEIVIVVGCVGVLFYKAVHELKKARNGGTKPIRKTALFEIAMLFVIVMYVNIIFVKICEMIGVGIQTPGFSCEFDWMVMYGLLDASVSEEIVFRVFCIGIPALIIALIMRKRDAPLRRYLIGGFGVSKISESIVFLILLSSSIFGVAHIAGWGEWKFYTTFISGLMLGYLFVKYGFYASLAMHFLIDYEVADTWLFGDSVIISPLVAIIIIVGLFHACLCVKWANIFQKLHRKSN